LTFAWAVHIPGRSSAATFSASRQFNARALSNIHAHVGEGVLGGLELADVPTEGLLAVEEVGSLLDGRPSQSETVADDDDAAVVQKVGEHVDWK
jgi:hypothetical protein